MTIEAEPQNKYREVNQTLVSEILKCSELSDELNDVLGANMAFRQLPALIYTRDSLALISNTEILAGRGSKLNLENASLEDIKIAQRDLSMFVTASTLITSDSEIPDADKIVPVGAIELLRLSRILDVPARTTDGNWASKDNPRFFTDDEVEIDGKIVKAEAIIKTCVGKNWDNREITAATLVRLSKFDMDSPEFAQLARKSAKDLSSMVSGITVLRKYLTDDHMDYFMHGFMPLTMQYRIGGDVSGEVLIHSGAGFFPFHLADALLGITTGLNPDDISYREQNIRSASKTQLVQFKAAGDYVRTNGSITEQIIATPKNHESAEGVLEMLKVIAQFRKAHVKAIEDSQAYRPNGESSGGHLTMAYQLRDRTVTLRNHIGELVKQRAA